MSEKSAPTGGVRFTLDDRAQRKVAQEVAEQERLKRLEEEQREKAMREKISTLHSKIKERRAELIRIRDTLNTRILVDTAIQGLNFLPLGEDTNESIATLKAIKEVDNLIAYCDVRLGYTAKKGSEELERGGTIAPSLDELFKKGGS